MQDFFNAGKQVKDPKIIGVKTSNSYVEPNDIILNTAIDLGIYIGELKCDMCKRIGDVMPEYMADDLADVARTL